MFEALNSNRLRSRLLRWLLIAFLNFIGVFMLACAFLDVSVESLAGKDVIEGYRRHGVYFFVLAIFWFFSVEWFRRFLKRRTLGNDNVV
jgi:hypothetical protein